MKKIIITIGLLSLWSTLSFAQTHIEICAQLKKLNVSNQTLKLKGCLDIDVGGGNQSQSSICFQLRELNVDEKELQVQGCIGGASNNEINRLKERIRQLEFSYADCNSRAQSLHTMLMSCR